MARVKSAAATYQPVTLRFPKEVLEQCRRVADQEDRSLNEQVLHVIKTWLSGQRSQKRVAESVHS